MEKVQGCILTMNLHCFKSLENQQDRQRTYNMMLRCIHETTVAVEMQYDIFLCVRAFVCECAGAWPYASAHVALII
jgi:hypothetical protein